jgi:hypothetical protein
MISSYVLVHLTNYIYPNRLIELLNVNKEINSFKSQEYIKKIIIEYKSNVTKYHNLKLILPNSFRKTFNKINKKDFSKYKLLFEMTNFKLNQYIDNGTGYIDYIKPEYFENSSIMYGKDCYKRFFITIRFKTIIESDVSNTVVNAITFFQRYTDNDAFFVNGGSSFYEYHSISNFNFDNYYLRMDDQFKIFFDLITYGKSQLVVTDYSSNKKIKYDYELV